MMTRMLGIGTRLMASAVLFAPGGTVPLNAQNPSGVLCLSSNFVRVAFVLPLRDIGEPG
jgi:hypothetical protein